MKRLLLTFFISITAALNLTANTEPIFPQRYVAGDFAIYKVRSPESYYYIGLCHYKDDQLIIRFYNPDRKEELTVLSTLMLFEGGITFSKNMKIMKGKIGSSELSDSIFPTILEWANKWYGIRSTMKTGEELLLNGENGYRFAYWIPVFQICSIGSQAQVKLQCAGVIKDLKDPVFFDFKGLPEIPGASGPYIKKSASFSPVVDGIRLPLDKNWKDEGQGRFSCKDAALSVETIKLSSYDISSIPELAAITILNPESLLLGESSQIFENKKAYDVQNRIYKPETKEFIQNQLMLYPRNDDYVSIVKLSVPLPLYLENKSYFDRILH